VRLAEAPSFGKPALFHDKDSRGALAYLALAGELLRRHDEQQLSAEAVAQDPAKTQEPEEIHNPAVTEDATVTQDAAVTPDHAVTQDPARSGT